MRNTTSDDEISIPEKRVIVRNNFDGDSANGKGTIIYGLNERRVSFPNSYERVSNTTDITFCQWKNLYIINMYQSSGANYSQVKMALSKIRDYLHQPNVLVCGDFNADLFDNSRHIVQGLLKYGLKLLSPERATTINNTIIDGVFGKLQDYKCEVAVYESYFSDHKPLVVRIYPEDRSSGLSQPFKTFGVNQ